MGGIDNACRDSLLLIELLGQQRRKNKHPGLPPLSSILPLFQLKALGGSGQAGQLPLYVHAAITQDLCVVLLAGGHFSHGTAM